MKWNAYGSVVGTKYLGEVEAEDITQALAKAEKLSQHVSLCHQCAREISDPEISEVTVEEAL